MANVQRWILPVLVAVVMATCPGTVRGKPTSIGKEHHPWGHFEPGAWKLVRVVTETLDEEGVVTSTSTETKTTLLKIEEDGITLGIEVTVEVAGKRFEAEPKCVKQGFHGEIASPDIKIGQARDAQLTIEGRNIPCRTQKIERSDASNKTVTNVYFSDKVRPRIIKRESITSDPKGKTKTSETTVTVVALDMPCKVLAEMKSSALMKTINKHAKGVVSTWALICRDVPGGVVEFWSKEVDGNGQLLSRSTLELLNYGLEPEEDPTRIGPLGRKRPPRTRKPGVAYP